MRSSAALFYLLSIPTEARTILLYCAKVSLFVCAPVGLKSDRSVLFNLVHKCKLAAVWMNKRLGLSFFFLSFFLSFFVNSSTDVRYVVVYFCLCFLSGSGCRYFEVTF